MREKKERELHFFLCRAGERGNDTLPDSLLSFFFRWRKKNIKKCNIFFFWGGRGNSWPDLVLFFWLFAALNSLPFPGQYFSTFLFYSAGQVSNKSPAVFLWESKDLNKKEDSSSLEFADCLSKDWQFFFQEVDGQFRRDCWIPLPPTMQARIEQITHCLCKAREFLKATGREEKNLGEKSFIYADSPLFD